MVFCYLLKVVKGKSNRDNIILSGKQFKDIKEIILENVLKVLLDILNDLFLVIMDKVSNVIKANTKDYVPTSRSTNSHDNNVKEIKESMNVNNVAWNNFIKKCKALQIFKSSTNIEDVTNFEIYVRTVKLKSQHISQESFSKSQFT